MDDRHLDALIKRWKARTDLIWLCNNVLGYQNVSEHLNGEMIRRMQKFPKPDGLEQMKKHDQWIPGKGWQYTPLLVNDKRLPGKLPHPNQFPGRIRRRLLLDSRGFYKSTINVVSHSIQWILNYPDITILVFQGSLDLAEKFLKEARDHFRGNEKLRKLFPEYCPENPDDWGASDQFTMINRTPGYIRKEPTMKATSIERGGAGQHVEVIKYSDIVNEDNSKTKDRCGAIYDLYATSINLLVSPIYWIDVEGTRYHLEDAYGKIIDEEMDEQRRTVWAIAVPGQDDKKIFFSKDEAKRFADEIGVKDIEELEKHYVPQPDKREYSVYINSCFKVAHPNPTFDYDDMLTSDIKFVVGPDGNRVSRSEEDYPAEKLEREARNKPEIFACQKLNNPTIANESSKFPVNAHYPRRIKREIFRQNIHPAYFEISVDIANTTHKQSDFTAIPVACFDQGGRCYIVEIRHGKWQEEQIADQIIELTNKYRPKRVLMEKDRGNSGVNVWLKRKCQLLDMHIPIHMLPKHTKQTKEEYIGSTLRPWYITGTLVFLDDLGLAFSHMCNELKGFPKGRWDDIIDAISHFFHDKQVLGRNSERPTMSHALWQMQKDKVAENGWMRHIGVYDDLNEPQSTYGEASYDANNITGWL